MKNAYWVQYGLSAFLGCFTASGPGRHARGDRVVVLGPRGLEIGTVLCEALDAHASREPLRAQEIVRAATIEDEARAVRLAVRGQDLLAVARSRAEVLGLSIDFIDVEVFLDERSAILHGLSWAECEATPLFAELTERFGWAVLFLDLARIAAVADEPAGCGKPGCGTDKGGCSSCGTSGGCSTGSCSSGKVRSAEELTTYFRDLRQKMEDDSTRRVPLA